MIRVFTATAYDKCMKDMSYETYIVEGVQDTDNEYGITDDDVHYYFAEGELDDRAYIDTDEFFYLIGEEIIKDDN